LLLRTKEGEDAEATARLKAHVEALTDLDVVGHVLAPGQLRRGRFYSDRITLTWAR
jgi:hypothetical protein